MIFVSAVLIGLAVTLGATAGDPVPAAANGSWSWEAGLPGAPLGSTGALSQRSQAAIGAALDVSEGVQDGSVRQVVTVNGASDGLTLLSGVGANGEPCFTMLTDLGGTREFSCLGNFAAQGAIVRFVGSAGPTVDVIDRVSFVGVVRSDVARVALMTAKGVEQELPLNQWRAFGFTTTSPDSFPVALRVYGGDGSLVEELPTYP
jgi:hypothetical protein